MPDMKPDENVTLTEREEIEALLPWFATDTLEPDEHARVQAYIDANPELQPQVAMVLDDRHATILNNETIAGPGLKGLERLRQSIDAEKSIVDRAAGGSRSLLSQLAQLFTAPTPSAVRWAGAAAAVVLVAQFVAIGSMVGDRSQPNNPYVTASGPKAGVASGSRVLIQFQDTASAVQIATFLGSIDAEITGGPKPGGLFEVRVSKTKLSEADLTEKVKQLTDKQELIKLVVPQG